MADEAEKRELDRVLAENERLREILRNLIAGMEYGFEPLMLARRKAERELSALDLKKGR